MNVTTIRPSEMIQFRNFDPSELDNAECAICLDNDPLKPMVAHGATTSKVAETVEHYFHKECLINAIKQKLRTCPLCRKTIDLTFLLSADQINAFENEEELILIKLLTKFVNADIKLHAFKAGMIGMFTLGAVSFYLGREFIWTSAALTALTNGFLGYYSSESAGAGDHAPKFIPIVHAINAGSIGGVASILSSYGLLSNFQIFTDLPFLYSLLVGIPSFLFYTPIRGVFYRRTNENDVTRVRFEFPSFLFYTPTRAGFR